MSEVSAGGKVGRPLRQPFHVEAYPRLDPRVARKAIRDGRNCLLWRDQDGHLVGMARVSLAGRQMRVEAWFRGLFHASTGRSVATLTVHVSGEDALVTCPCCGQRRRALVFAQGSWQCRTCHQLVYRSSIVTARVRDAERLAELDRYLADGRPRYLRHDLYEQVRKERYWLRYVQEGRVRVAPSHQRLVLSAGWMAEPAPITVSDDQMAAMPDEDPDVLELVGESLFAGETLLRRVEDAVRVQVEPTYRVLWVGPAKPSALQVRRDLPEIAIGELPVLAAPADITIVDPAAEILEARMALPFAGDPALFGTGLPASSELPRPIGVIAGNQLMLAVRFSPANAVFVAALLHAELDRVRACLTEQGRAVDAVQDGTPVLVKRVVAEEWPRLRGLRRKA